MRPATEPLPVHEAFSVGRLLQTGWDLVSRAPVPLLLGAFLLMLVDACSGGSGQISPPTGDWSGEGGGGLGELEALIEELGTATMVAMAGAMVGCGLLLQAAAWLARSWLMVGWLRLHEEALVQGDADVATLFGGRDRFWPLALWYLLRGFIRFGVAMVALTPGLLIVGAGAWGVWGDRGSGATADLLPLGLAGGVVMLALWLPAVLYIEPGLALGDRAVVFGGLSPVDALDRSWDLARDNRLTLLSYQIVGGLVVGAGWMACCVGAIPARAVVDAGLTAGWLLHTRADRADWAVQPPDLPVAG